ncbi:bifunctional 2-polyprenyl-6-hydroxyphenol methylase/3-demethylubiquinol 3-O-methyltransferase UbiG [Paraferrimonas sp. SM1919]|uniref:bifunctional 2-polyprenyl-6-hydroxyphenol methylase/3-demethylubiquinol 3-O-methyltransferase UbiG n=1 Tax=Paraferrimonas sp. SM1919 TaxID=2662263 RepID=UPI0013D0447C|nr:bifunctional 2-polyprenyl-6-hydroxyphenol methylase/3-demethylubiquinol 3-O-methyltransferase UbiG [Paraferrimonas sp. SM1919]
MSNNQNVDPQEISKFEKMAATWWDLQGDFKPLHKMNHLRLDYIDRGANGLFGKKVLDVGCGGGILAESMAKLGAKVDGIDMGHDPLEVAKLHALEAGVEVNYQQITAEQHAQTHQQHYDVVTCMEMLEHVPDPASVINACQQMLKPGGVAFFSTINRTVMSYLQAIIGAEYVLKMLPKGTHDHSKFMKPSELIQCAENNGLVCEGSMGVKYNPLTEIFSLTADLGVNYMIITRKQS